MWPIGFSWQDGDEIGHFDSGLPLLGASAGELGNVGDTGPISLQIGTEFLADQDHTMLDAPTMSIERLVLLKVGMRISKIGSQIALECGLIAFDDKERIGVLGTEEVPELTVGMQRIKSADTSANGQGRKQFTRFWNFVGFFAYCQFSPDFFTLVREAGKQMGASPSAVLAPRTVLPSTARGSVGEARVVALTHVESTSSTA